MFSIERAFNICDVKIEFFLVNNTTSPGESADPARQYITIKLNR